MFYYMLHWTNNKIISLIYVTVRLGAGKFILGLDISIDLRSFGDKTADEEGG